MMPVIDLSQLGGGGISDLRQITRAIRPGAGQTGGMTAQVTPHARTPLERYQEFENLVNQNYDVRDAARQAFEGMDIEAVTQLYPELANILVPQVSQDQIGQINQMFAKGTAGSLIAKKTGLPLDVIGQLRAQYQAGTQPTGGLQQGYMVGEPSTPTTGYTGGGYGTTGGTAPAGSMAGQIQQALSMDLSDPYAQMTLSPIMSAINQYTQSQAQQAQSGLGARGMSPEAISAYTQQNIQNPAQQAKYSALGDYMQGRIDPMMSWEEMIRRYQTQQDYINMLRTQGNVQSGAGGGGATGYPYGTGGGGGGGQSMVFGSGGAVNVQAPGGDPYTTYARGEGPGGYVPVAQGGQGTTGVVPGWTGGVSYRPNGEPSTGEINLTGSNANLLANLGIGAGGGGTGGGITPTVQGPGLPPAGWTGPTGPVTGTDPHGRSIYGSQGLPSIGGGTTNYQGNVGHDVVIPTNLPQFQPGNLPSVGGGTVQQPYQQGAYAQSQIAPSMSGRSYMPGQAWGQTQTGYTRPAPGTATGRVLGPPDPHQKFGPMAPPGTIEGPMMYPPGTQGDPRKLQPGQAFL